MKPRLAILATAGGAMLLQGCVAAVPVAAGAAIARHGLHGRPAAATPPPAAAPVPAPGAGGSIAVPPGMQFLYGSGEAAAASLQTYRALDTYLMARASDRSIGHEVKSVVLAPGATLDQPVFEPCGAKPLAVVFDIDETAVLNLGFEADQTRRNGAYDQQRWLRWEQTGQDQVVAVPGVVDAIDIARRTGIAVVFNSNRSAASGNATAAMLEGAGLGKAVRGDTLWLAGDAGAGNDKDARRRAISQKYCVIALVGDQLGDFSDLFNAAAGDIAARRGLVSGREVEWLWGLGWFVLPNPVYGSALKGGFDEVYPEAKRWTDPADDGAAPPPGATRATGGLN